MKFNPFMKTILLIALCICVVANPVEKEKQDRGETSGKCGGDLWWSYDSTTKKLQFTGDGWIDNYNDFIFVPWYPYTKSIETIVFEGNASMIGQYAFCGCSNLRSVSLPSTLAIIRTYAFGLCENLQSIKIPASVTYLDRSSFQWDCTNLSVITVEEGNPYYEDIDGVVFDKRYSVVVLCPPGKSGDFVIPDYVREIRGNAFLRCERLSSVTISEGVQKIDNYAFQGCTGLSSVTIPESVVSIPSSPFISCTSLTNIQVNEKNQWYKSVDGILFSKNGTVLIQHPPGRQDDFVIPEDVTRVVDGAFEGNQVIRSVTVSSGAVLNNLPLPFSGCTNLTSIEVDGRNQNYKSINGVLFNKDGTVLLVHPHGKQGNYTIPATCTQIRDLAFYQSAGLTSISIPAGVKLDDYFSPFESCTSLMWIDVDENNPLYKSIDGVLFSKNGTVLLQYPCGRTGSYTIPDHVTTIGQFAFGHCNGLTSVTIPAGVSSVERYAFSNCPNLEVVTYLGTSNPLHTSSVFMFCDNVRATCVPTGYQSSNFCGLYNICDSCAELEVIENHCFEAVCENNVLQAKKRANVTEWEKKSNECFEYQCDNNTGLFEMNKCSGSVSFLSSSARMDRDFLPLLVAIMCFKMIICSLFF